MCPSKCKHLTVWKVLTFFFYQISRGKIIFLQSWNIFESVVFYLWGWGKKGSQFPGLVQSLKEEYALFCRIPRPWINDLQVGLPRGCNIPNAIINAFVSFSYNSAELIFHLHPTNPRRWPSYPRFTRKGLTRIESESRLGLSPHCFLPSIPNRHFKTLHKDGRNKKNVGSIVVGVLSFPPNSHILFFSEIQQPGNTYLYHQVFATANKSFVLWMTGLKYPTFP